MLYETPSSYRIYIYANKVFLHVLILHHHIVDCIRNSRRQKSRLKVSAEKFFVLFCFFLVQISPEYCWDWYNPMRWEMHGEGKDHPPLSTMTKSLPFSRQ